MTLPDGEVLTHAYDAGGNLASITGVEKAQGANTSTGGMTTTHLQTLLYDKFEQRTYLKLGNGVETHYTYRADNRRLKNLLSQDNAAGQFQNLNYGYDAVGNITDLKNDVPIPPPSGMGGPTKQHFGYDDLYRLTSIYKHLEREGDAVVNGEIVQGGTGTGATTTQAQQFLCYHHPDHLGSTGYVTDAKGNLYEHLEYFPFGETWVQEHSNTLRTPYLFTGKEFDQETGLYYFGARYYDPRTSVWQSADAVSSFTVTYLFLLCA